MNEFLDQIEIARYNESKKRYDGSFYIFIRATAKELDDKTLLKALNLGEFSFWSQENKPEKDNCGILITETEGWIHIIDNWSYSLWSKLRGLKGLEKLGAKFDVFYCMAPDLTEGVNFGYFKDGQLLRNYMVEHWVYPNMRVNVGNLPNEAQIFEKGDHFEGALRYAEENLGIKIYHDPKKARTYTAFEDLDFSFDEDEVF
ncbi:hypothetical protein FUAX_34220 [Fulvitalea axinellae]|uniref:YubB ferredoxin-like domain-containing protein n=1 Tax=Fulvitalea axinellae TaxID=1182444 RepID=A0AAU9DIM3_9BACT|nr:hypothetical protein FUAX_34220 [Fulvitalea axinellae]